MKRLIVILAVMALVPAAAQALPITGSSSGTFSNLDTSWFAEVTNSNHTVRWGSDAWFYFNDPSTLTSTSPFSFNSSTPVNGLKLAELVWFNSSTASIRTPDEFDVRWNLAVTFTAPPGSDGDQISLTINNTMNPLGDDIFLDDLSGLNFNLANVVVSNLRYVVEGTGSYSNLHWYNPEVGTSKLYIVADFAQPVPEPASMLLLGTGLVGLAGAARRRMRK